jgi:hypothetical protein
MAHPPLATSRLIGEDNKINVIAYRRTEIMAED